MGCGGRKGGGGLTGPRGEGCHVRHGVCMLTEYLYNAIVQCGVWSRAKYSLALEEMGPRSQKFWGLRESGGFGLVFGVPGILWVPGYFFGVLTQGRKPHGGFEGPRFRPPLIFLRGGGPRPLG
jgi:hypothetical protein